MKNKKGANIRDVAQAAGISRTTVSLVLNNSPVPSAETRERVFQAAKELNYRANPVYRQAQRRRADRGGLISRTETIGFLTSAMAFEKVGRRDGYYARFHMGIERYLSAAKYYMMHQTITSEDRVLPSVVLDGKVDGVIVETSLTEYLGSRLVQQIPTVFLDWSPSPIVADVVLTDLEQAVYRQLDYLWNLGHRRIVAFLPAVSAASVRTYLWAFNSFFEQRGLTAPSILPLSWPISSETHNQVMADYARAVASLKERPTAIISWDVYACPLTEEFAALGIRVPEEISLIGMDNSMATRLTRPKLTSYGFPLEEMGATAAEMLIQRIKNPERMPRRITFNGELVERGSCAPPPLA